MSQSDGMHVRSYKGNYIGGRVVPPHGGAYFQSLNPATGQPIGEFARSDAQDVDAAVRDAEAGFRKWVEFEPAARGRVLNEIARRLRERIDEFAHCECLDCGKPLRNAKKDMAASARYMEYYAGLTDKIEGELLQVSNQHHVYTRFEPYGVTGHIIPWNSPLSQLCRGAAPALAAGNSLVIKPAEQTPLTALMFAELCVECGLPPGVLNVVTGFGEEAGDALARHPGVRRLTFTGSVETGRVVMKIAADRVVPVTSELGGKSPIVVFEDADLDQAAQACVNAYVGNAGQSCSAGTRILVQDSIYARFVEQMAALIKDTVTYGPGLEDYTIGPLVSEVQLKRVLSFIEAGASEGARLMCGGKPQRGGKLGDGYFIEPTLFADVTRDMRIFQEEIFGPVGAAVRFSTEAQAIELANDTKYGLVGGVFTRDLSRAHRVAGAIMAGQVFVNNYRQLNVEIPFGGYKQSGIGREKGTQAVKHYLQMKTVVVRL